jgi:hypothetical protein
LSGGHLSHVGSDLLFLIIAGRIIWIKWWLIGLLSRCRGDEIAARYGCEFIDRHMSMFGAVLIPHRLPKGLLVLCCIGCLVLRINIHSLVPHSKGSQVPGSIEDVWGYKKHARHWSHFAVVFGKLRSS